MGHQSIVYGRIIGDKYNNGQNISNDRLLFHRLNRMAVEDLPLKDEYPQLTRQMFLFPSLNPGDGLYKNQVISFGASYKEVELVWSEWLTKFEDILMKLYWTNAVVHLETEFCGNHTYNWKNENDSPFQANLRNSSSNWKFEGGPIEFKYH